MENEIINDSEINNLYSNIKKLQRQRTTLLYERMFYLKDENKTIGILLSTDKNEIIVKYTLPKDNKIYFHLNLD